MLSLVFQTVNKRIKNRIPDLLLTLCLSLENQKKERLEDFSSSPKPCVQLEQNYFFFFAGFFAAFFFAAAFLTAINKSPPFHPAQKYRCGKAQSRSAYQVNPFTG
jgi:hypothetical protein